MAKWPIVERADDLEKAQGYSKQNAKAQDTRKQEEPKPCQSEGNCN